MNYNLTRSNRKSIAIYIRGGKLDVRAPYHMAQLDIEAFLLSRMDWINKTLTSQQARLLRRESFVVDYGSEIVFRGKQYPIALRQGARAGFDGQVFFMPQGLVPVQIRDNCIKIYKKLAKSFILERVAFFAAQMGVAPLAVRVNSAKTRWGSCSSQKNLNFSWRIIMADDSVVDYVVVHELAHLVEMNHSSRFWAIVDRVLPDFAVRKAQLKALNIKLSGEDWN